jgi:hypothetical protein
VRKGKGRFWLFVCVSGDVKLGGATTSSRDAPRPANHSMVMLRALKSGNNELVQMEGIKYD